MSNFKHIFSLYYPTLSIFYESLAINGATVLDDKALCSRIVSVLRLKKGNRLILFDRFVYACVELQEVDKKKCIAQLIEKKENTIVGPNVTVLLPLLKKDDLEKAIYDVTAVGVANVQLMITEKVQRIWGEQKEYDRLIKIMIAAAEQSKCYTFARLQKPMCFFNFFSTALIKDSTNIFADPIGQSFFDTMENLKNKQPKEIILFIGPEGDITAQEKEYLKEHRFIFCKLTPTVLRARQAIGLLAGAVRSIMY